MTQSRKGQSVRKAVGVINLIVAAILVWDQISDGFTVFKIGLAVFLTVMSVIMFMTAGAAKVAGDDDATAQT
jgi:uncharacterized membrane protein